jgi:asparagine synthase (glutamine-hydrolysing)
MCGICGVVSLGRPPETETVERMTAELAHRGPDGYGSFADEGIALGHLRLAIIDLSDAGLQPFASEDGTLQLLHNGEVYNYRELRSELEAKDHRFTSATDTEVILAAYREWGERCVERFNGMWAFALWDTAKRTLFCSRDRFGVKPFYYRLDGDRFSFASEPRAFRAGPQPLEPNRSAVRDYLEQGWLDHTDETFLTGIRRLPPAHSLTFGPRGLALKRYWRLEPDDPPRDPVAAVRELFVDSVRLRLRSDVPVGTALSGGIDSSAIACVIDHLLRTEAENARPVGERQKTFTAYFEDPGFDERPFARAVVERTRTDAHWVSFSADELVADLPAIVEAQGEPFGSTSIAAGWYVMRAAARDGLKVMLDGQGGDEVLAGYRAAYGYRVADLLGEGRLRELRTELAAFRSRHGANLLVAAGTLARPFLPERLGAAARARLKGSAPLVHPELRSGTRPDTLNGSVFPDRLRRYLDLLLTRRGLPELLRYEDRNSMAHSLEARVPFLDYRLVELCFSLDGAQLIERGRTKAVLRRALEDLLPPAVHDRTDKLGFVTPEGRWLRGALGELAADAFASRSFAERGFVDAPAARRRLERHRRGEIGAGMELWRALNVELWARTYLDRKP